MTIINTNYTTLEDAWGSNFDINVSKKNKKIKKGTASKPDPLCELYSRRLKKAKKPYENDKYTGDEKYRAYKGHDRALYYKYEDDEFHSLVNPERQKTSFLTVDDELNNMALNTDFDESFDNSNECIDVNSLRRVSTNKKKKKIKKSISMLYLKMMMMYISKKRSFKKKTHTKKSFLKLHNNDMKKFTQMYMKKQMMNS